MRLVPLPAGVATEREPALQLRHRISEKLSVEVPVVAWRGQGFLRLAANVYNRPRDYERLAEGLPKLLA
jgi:isopenicillin-N epimerase